MNLGHRREARKIVFTTVRKGVFLANKNISSKSPLKYFVKMIFYNIPN